jgi:hypothetical protein
MNSDNKFGICCSCPAIMNNPRELTLWSSSHIYDSQMMNKNGIKNSHDYRSSLQSNGENIIRNTINDFNSNYKCRNTDQNKFYLDSSNYNQYYDNLNKIPNNSVIPSISGKTIPGVGVNVESDINMSLSNISFSSLNTRNAEFN